MTIKGKIEGCNECRKREQYGNVDSSIIIDKLFAIDAKVDSKYFK